MEIQQSKCWEDSMHFSDGKTGFTSKLFYITDCDRSPNLLSRDACYTLGVLIALLYCGKGSLELVRLPHILLNLK